MKHSFINWIWIDFRAPKFERHPRLPVKGYPSVSIETGKLEDSSPQLHLKASGDSQFSGEGSVMKPPASWNKKKAVHRVSCGFWVAIYLFLSLTLWPYQIFTTAEIVLLHLQDLRFRSLFGSMFWGDACGGDVRGGNPVYRQTWNKGNLARSNFFLSKKCLEFHRHPKQGPFQ